MADTSSVLEDSTLLSAFDRHLYRVEAVLALAGGFAVMALLALAVTSVGGRNFFNHPLPGYVDWIEQAMPLIAFIGIAYCQRLGGHIRMNMFIARLRGRVLWAAEFVGTLAILLLVVLLVWGSWAHFERSFDWTAPYWSRSSPSRPGNTTFMTAWIWRLRKPGRTHPRKTGARMSHLDTSWMSRGC